MERNNARLLHGLLSSSAEYRPNNLTHLSDGQSLKFAQLKYRVPALFSPFVQNGVERTIFDGPLLKTSSSRFQLDAPFFTKHRGLHVNF